jgi:hypothetical protein
MIKFMIDTVRNIWEDSYSVVVAVVVIIGLVLLCLGIAFGAVCLQAWVVMLLWNWIAVELFSLPTIGFWLAFGLCWLCNLLFRSSITIKKKFSE